MNTIPEIRNSLIVHAARRVCLPASLLLSIACTPVEELEFEDVQLRSGPVCGDAIVEGAELCDDGNLDDDDGCDATCLPSGIDHVSMGDATTCALTFAGNVKCWGRNEWGQLGRGDTSIIGDGEALDTVAFVDLGGAARQIHTNGDQTFALMRDGTVRGWGQNGGSQLGLLHTNDIGDDETVAQAGSQAKLRVGGNVVQLAQGRDFACARTSDGGVRCWGANDSGQLGYGHTETIGDDELPLSAGNVELGGSAVELVAGASHACALLAGGELSCWGRGSEGQLGYGNLDSVGDAQTPASAGRVDAGGTVVQVVAGDHHTCARLDTNAVRCWGDGLRGQLGYGTSHQGTQDHTPAMRGDVPVGAPVVDLAAGSEHTCAVLDTGALRCWGANDWGQLGLTHVDDIGDDETPQQSGAVDLGTHKVAAVFMGTGALSTCVLLEDGALRCWGGNDSGQLGYGHTLAVGDEPGEAPGNLPDIMLLDGDDGS